MAPNCQFRSRSGETPDGIILRHCMGSRRNSAWQALTLSDESLCMNGGTDGRHGSDARHFPQGPCTARGDRFRPRSRRAIRSIHTDGLFVSMLTIDLRHAS